jgi:hypothetical protein
VLCTDAWARSETVNLVLDVPDRLAQVFNFSRLVFDTGSPQVLDRVADVEVAVSRYLDALDT